MSDLKFAIVAKKLADFIKVNDSEGEQQIVFEVDFDASSGHIVPTMTASLPTTAGARAAIKICPTPTPPGGCP
jgi:hypothetical protein